MEENQNPTPHIPQPQEAIAPSVVISEQKPKFPFKLVVFMVFLVLIVGIAGFIVGKNSNPVQKDPMITKTPSPTNAIQLPTMTPPPVAITNPTANWKTYTNDTYKYSVKHPPELTVETNDPRFVWIGKNIYVAVTDTDPEKCLGGCPLIESAIDSTIDNIKSRRIYGEIGAIGGNIPQKIQEIVIPHVEKFYSFTLYALEKDIKSTNETLPEISNDKILMFDKIISTFKFTK